MMEELREEYLESFEEKFNLMRTCLANKEWYALELEFHKLKGTGTTYGVPEVTEMCQVVEDICRTQTEISSELLNSAINLLTKIKQKYTDKIEFELSKDPEFALIKAA